MIKQLIITILLSIIIAKDPPSAGTPTSPVCGGNGATVHSIDDGVNARCFSVITPSSAKTPMPILIFFHGSGGSARFCGAGKDASETTLVELSTKYGFAFVCGEALQYERGGQWNIPEVITDATGNKCEDSDTVEIKYMKNMIAKLQEQSDQFDTTKIFFAGCSLGSAMSIFSSTCFKPILQDSLTAFATHSTGLKVKGDGLGMPPDLWDSEYRWGECPECQYFPAKPEKFTNLKACIFDNTEDAMPQAPYFYESSVNMAAAWKELGNDVETNFQSGGHCQIHSYDDMVTCMDNGTNRLISASASKMFLQKY